MIPSKSGIGASLAFQDAVFLHRNSLRVIPRTTLRSSHESRSGGVATRMAREACFEAAMTFLESQHFQQLRNTLVKHTLSFDFFIK